MTYKHKRVKRGQELKVVDKALRGKGKEALRLSVLETQGLNILQEVRAIKTAFDHTLTELTEMQQAMRRTDASCGAIHAKINGDTNIGVVELSKRLDSVVRTIAGHVQRVDETIRAEVAAADKRLQPLEYRHKHPVVPAAEFNEQVKRVEELFKITVSQHNRISALERKRRK